MKRAALFVLLLVGCGGSSESPLVGKWVYAGSQVGMAFDFKPDDTYVALVGELNASGGLNAVYESGTFSATDVDVTLVPDKSSCGVFNTATDGYRVSGSTLTLMIATGSTTLSRYTDTGATGMAVYGCFDSAGNFTEQPVASK